MLTRIIFLSAFLFINIFTLELHANASCADYYFRQENIISTKVRVISIGKADHALKLRTTDERVAEAEEKASRMAEYLTNVAIDPTTIQTTAANSAMESFNQTTEQVARFLDGNTVLTDTRNNVFSDTQTATSGKGLISIKNEAGKASLSSVDIAAKSIDELMVNLRALGAASSSKRGLVSRLSKIPLIGPKIEQNYSRNFENIKSKILEVDLAIVESARNLHENNGQLEGLKTKAQEYANELTQEIISLKLLSESLENELYSLKQTDPHAANIMESEIIPRVERQLSDKKSLFGVLIAGQEAINQVIQINHGLIEDAANLRNVAAPAISINTTIAAVANKAQLAAKRHRAVRAFTNESLRMVGEHVKKANELYYEEAGKPTVDPEILNGLLTTLANEKSKRLERQIQIGLALKESNHKMVQVFNQNLLSIQQEGVSSAVEKALSNLQEEGSALLEQASEVPQP